HINLRIQEYSQAMQRGLALDDDNKIEGLRRLTSTVQRYGSKIFAQIYHVGRQAAPQNIGRSDAQAPSARMDVVTGCHPREMTIDEIKETVQLFGEAAGRAKKAGFDGVEIHGAHGYLISSFLTPHTNRRTDEYGGSFENRLRFLLEIYRAVRANVGSDFPVILKINGHDDLPLRKGLKTAELVKIAKCLEDEGLDGVEISAGHYESCMTSERGNWRGFFKTVITQGSGQEWPTSQRLVLRVFGPLLEIVFNLLSGYRKAFNLPYAHEFKQALNIPVICVGGFSDRETIEEAIASGGCDMVAAARPLIADPHMYNHMKTGVQGPRCDFCQGCFARSGALPADCYNTRVKADKDRMLEAEAQRIPLATGGGATQAGAH
ncbi:MAG: NADH:flavin oxidoreductase, partial [Halioglobus sp.]|nr:NADH:flavin oxidoreductase [Halioglobus sp.]